MDPIVFLLHDTFSQLSIRELAPQVFRELLLSHPHIQLLYWKKQDNTHREDSPPDGACGWHTIAQAHYRHQTGNLLNLSTKKGLTMAANILTGISSTQAPVTEEGRHNIQHAIRYIQRKHPAKLAASLPDQHQLSSDDYTTYCNQHQASLFIQPSAGAMHSYLQMPQDTTRAWLQHHASTGESRRSGIVQLSALPLTDILDISVGSSFAQLACGHFWLYPNLTDERLQCNQALDNFAVSIWDTLQGTSTPKLIPPANTTWTVSSVTDTPLFQDSVTPIRLEEVVTPPPPPAMASSNAATGSQKRSGRSIPLSPGLVDKAVCKSPLTKPKPLPSKLSALARCWYPSRDPISNSTTATDTTMYDDFSSCFGTSIDGCSRLTLGPLSRTTLMTLLSEFQRTTRAEASELLRSFLSSRKEETTLGYWKRPDYNHWSDCFPDGACGWYTLAFLRWRSLHGTTLNFEDADDLRRGSDILSLLAEQHHAVSNTGDASITFAQNWMLNPNRSDFPSDHQLRSCDLTELCGHSILALFLVPNEFQAPRSLHMPDSLDSATAWAQMTHHSLRPHGGEMSPSLTYSLLRGKENLPILETTTTGLTLPYLRRRINAFQRSWHSH